jgi:hypothetical protein
MWERRERAVVKRQHGPLRASRFERVKVAPRESSHPLEVEWRRLTETLARGWPHTDIRLSSSPTEADHVRRGRPRRGISSGASTGMCRCWRAFRRPIRPNRSPRPSVHRFFGCMNLGVWEAHPPGTSRGPRSLRIEQRRSKRLGGGQTGARVRRWAADATTPGAEGSAFVQGVAQGSHAALARRDGRCDLCPIKSGAAVPPLARPRSRTCAPVTPYAGRQ